MSLLKIAKRFTKDERGVTAIEYAIIGVAISAIVLAVVADGGLGKALGDAMTVIDTNIGKAETVTTQ
ncbi:Flp family type IVb pilin [Enterovibrio makurazakiensis]|uniref:Flp family type IVb pilin n=1 Tax=Enterovibrio gelatinilyticus TaxID=2899819 RepID=A0ABT5R317_9GAMM|nr:MULTISPECIES: Flp family type IVb pilin [Enterovibrio]MDD1794657.1 Flp family type IVb pilin [Enterovibrio sp. ZSDZ42]